MKKTIITIFAAVCLLLAMFPATAFAAAPTVCRADICGGQDFAAERIAFVKPTVTATGSQVRICKYCEAESDDITPGPISHTASGIHAKATARIVGDGNRTEEIFLSDTPVPTSGKAPAAAKSQIAAQKATAVSWIAVLAMVLLGLGGILAGKHCTDK
jgi:hypothetical protein